MRETGPGSEPPAPASPPPGSEGRQRYPVIDTGRYRWMIGAFGIVLALTVAVYLLLSRGLSPIGVPAGQRLHYFVAPLATSGLNLDANTAPRCDPSRPNPRALNVCGRRPMVLALFLTGYGACIRQVDTLQAVSRRAPHGLQFAAVAVKAGKRTAYRLVRSHHWTIPVAYDRDGAVGALYHVEVCPLVELAHSGGVVAARLTGNQWTSARALSAQVRALLGQGRG